MNVEYCTQCGHKNTYTAVAPNFCAACGTPMSKHNSVASSPSVVQNSPVVEESQDVPFISKLEYEVEGTEDNRKTTIGDLVKLGPSESSGPVRPRKKGRPAKKLSQQQILKQSLEECKSSRTKPPEEIE